MCNELNLGVCIPKKIKKKGPNADRILQIVDLHIRSTQISALSLQGGALRRKRTVVCPCLLRFLICTYNNFIQAKMHNETCM